MNNTEKILELRNGFYKWVSDYVEEKSTTVRNLRQPSEERGKRKKGKIIGIVGSVTQAVQIKAEIEGRLADTNAQLVTLGMKTASITPINIKTEIINPSGDVALTETPAERRIPVEGKALRNEIKNCIEYLKTQEKTDDWEIGTTEELYKSIKASELYIRGTDSGYGYRVTYFSGMDGCRKQQSVCDVLIIVGNEDTKLVDAPKRKERADKAEQIGVYYNHFAGAAVLHRVYAFDKRYINRHLKRLDNK